MHPAIRELRRAWPFALVLGLVLGAVVVLGANLSNAFPSRDRPFGWPGPASFENGVAMVRGDIVLATTLPALLMGATALRERHPTEDGPRTLLLIFGVDAALLVAGAFLAAGIGAWGAAKAPPQAFLAFAVASALLALAFWSLAFLVSALLPRHRIATSLGVWGFFNLLYEGTARTILFRQEGYEPLASGQFPMWFWVSQALSPLTSYRGVLILWRPGFKDYVEKAILTPETPLPAWMTPFNFGAVMVALWILIPVGLALAAWWTRGRLATRMAQTRSAPSAE